MDDTGHALGEQADAAGPGGAAKAAGPGEAGPAETASGRRRREGRGGRGRWLRRLGDILLIAGGLVLSYPFWSAGYAQVQQSRLDSAYQEKAAAFASAAAVSPDVRVQHLPRAEVVRRLGTLFGERLQAGDPIGRLRIPRVGLDRLVQQGSRRGGGLDPASDRALLRNGPVHYAVTPLPGVGDPFAIAGHRTTYGAPFYELDRLQKGDPIFLDTPYARFRYRVAKTSVVRPQDVGVLYDRGYGLVLTTCTPPYSASRRLVVWAKLDRAVPLKKVLSGGH
jgi:sortase A